MKAVVGLGNPGAEYEGTRHNVGSEVVSALAESEGGRFKRGPSRVRCHVADVMVGAAKVILGVPMTYMNESGGPVKSLVEYFDVAEEHLLVIHDDIDLPFGRLRVQVGGGTGGHNGLRSIEKALGHRNFMRLKVGVGRPPGRMDPADFVLRRFTKSERIEVDLMVGDAVEIVGKWVDDVDAATRLAGERRPA